MRFTYEDMAAGNFPLRGGEPIKSPRRGVTPVRPPVRERVLALVFLTARGTGSKARCQGVRWVYEGFTGLVQASDGAGDMCPLLNLDAALCSSTRGSHGACSRGMGRDAPRKREGPGARTPLVALLVDHPSVAARALCLARRSWMRMDNLQGAHRRAPLSGDGVGSGYRFCGAPDRRVSAATRRERSSVVAQRRLPWRVAPAITMRVPVGTPGEFESHVGTAAFAAEHERSDVLPC